MRILHVVHQYAPVVGGTERYMTQLSEELARRGHQVDVFTSRSTDSSRWDNSLPRFERLNGVAVRRFDSLPRTRLAWSALERGLQGHWSTGSRWYEPLIFWGNGPVSPRLFWALLRDGGRYDLMHIGNLHYAHAYTAFLAARRHRLPVILSPLLHMEQRATYDVGYLRRVLRESQTVLAVTASEQRFIRQQGWNREVTVGGVGLDLDAFPSLDRDESRRLFGIPATARVILFLGRKTEYKGLDRCLQAFRQLRQTDDQLHFLAVGPETEFSRALWRRHGSLPGLVVRDRVSEEERLAALAACDLLALPSAGESFGIVYLEAWAYGKPVIGARIPAVSSLVQHGHDGLLVQPDDGRALLQALSFLLTHPEQAARMGQHGREKLERRYTVARIADIVEGVYARVLRRKQTQTNPQECFHAG